MTELFLNNCPLLSEDLEEQLKQMNSLLHIERDGNEGGMDAEPSSPGGDPMSTTKEAPPAWGNLMSFLTNNVEKVGIASCQKARRPRHQ